jgi:hypothetical protein
VRFIVRTILSLAMVAALSAAAASAQDQEFTRPPDWQIRFDHPAPDSAIYFVDMPPGWHITTGPAAILFDPAMTATAPFRLESKIFLFPGEYREGYGIIFGGTDLEGEAQAYVYFLLRKDGRFLVKQRHGAETTTHIPWTAHDAIVPHDGGESPVENVLAVVTNTDAIIFEVNGTEVGRLERASLAADGVVGLRVNHRLNLHVASLTVESP